MFIALINQELKLITTMSRLSIENLPEILTDPERESLDLTQQYFQEVAPSNDYTLQFIGLSEGIRLSVVHPSGLDSQQPTITYIPGALHPSTLSLPLIDALQNLGVQVIGLNPPGSAGHDSVKNTQEMAAVIQQFWHLFSEYPIFSNVMVHSIGGVFATLAASQRLQADPQLDPFQRMIAINPSMFGPIGTANIFALFANSLSASSAKEYMGTIRSAAEILGRIGKIVNDGTTFQFVFLDPVEDDDLAARIKELLMLGELDGAVRDALRNAIVLASNSQGQPMAGFKSLEVIASSDDSFGKGRRTDPITGLAGMHASFARSVSDMYPSLSPTQKVRTSSHHVGEKEVGKRTFHDNPILDPQVVWYVANLIATIVKNDT